MSVVLLFVLQATASSPTRFDVAMARPLLPRCGAASADEIVVCADTSDRYRLPLPVARAGPERGEARSGMDALTPPTRCGIFAGERQCGKKEAAEYGYGNGRNPITILFRLAGKIVDPDGN